MTPAAQGGGAGRLQCGPPMPPGGGAVYCYRSGQHLYSFYDSKNKRIIHDNQHQSSLKTQQTPKLIKRADQLVEKHLLVLLVMSQIQMFSSDLP